MGIRQFSALHSYVKKNWASFEESREAFIRERRYELRTVRLFNCRQSMQNQALPSGLGMRTTGLSHYLWLCSMTLSSSTISTWTLMSFCVQGPMRYGFCLTGIEIGFNSSRRSIALLEPNRPLHKCQFL